MLPPPRLQILGTHPTATKLQHTCAQDQPALYRMRLLVNWDLRPDVPDLGIDCLNMQKMHHVCP